MGGCLDRGEERATNKSHYASSIFEATMVRFAFENARPMSVSYATCFPARGSGW